MSYLKCNQLIFFLTKLDRLYNKWIPKQELNCELLLLFQFNVVTISFRWPKEAQGEPRLISSVQLLSRVWLFWTPCTTAREASLSITNPWRLLKPMSIESVMPSNHLIFCYPLLLLPSIFPSIRVFSNESVLASGGQSIGVSDSSSVLPMNIQDWFPLGWTGWISLQSKGLSRVFSNTTVQKHQFFSAELPL